MNKFEETIEFLKVLEEEISKIIGTNLLKALDDISEEAKK